MDTRNNIPLIKVAVGCLVNKNQEVLVAQRAKNKLFAHLWEFPGGKLEPGESYRQALCRELKEEIGIELNIDSTRFLAAKAIDYQDFSCKLEFFLCKEWMGEIKSLEAQQLAWHKINDLTKIEMLEANCEVVELLINLALLNKI